MQSVKDLIGSEEILSGCQVGDAVAQLAYLMAIKHRTRIWMNLVQWLWGGVNRNESFHLEGSLLTTCVSEEWRVFSGMYLDVSGLRLLLF